MILAHDLTEAWLWEPIGSMLHPCPCLSEIIWTILQKVLNPLVFQEPVSEQFSHKKTHTISIRYHHYFRFQLSIPQKKETKHLYSASQGIGPLMANVGQVELMV